MQPLQLSSPSTHSIEKRKSVRTGKAHIGWKPRTAAVEALPEGTVVCQVRYFPRVAVLDVVRP